MIAAPASVAIGWSFSDFSTNGLNSFALPGPYPVLARLLAHLASDLLGALGGALELIAGFVSHFAT